MATGPIACASYRRLLERERKVALGRQTLQHPHRLLRDLGANTISGQHSKIQMP
jgi:hypothetical protein